MAKKKRVVKRAGTTETATPAATAPQPRRRVQRAGSARPTRVARGSTVADLEPLDPADAAIPFDHVPYVPADLRRVTAMALVMLVLIVIAAFIVPHLVGA